MRDALTHRQRLLGLACGLVTGFFAGLALWRLRQARCSPAVIYLDGDRAEPAGFDRRVYDLASFRRALDDMFAHLDDLRAATRSGRIGKAFAERIMLAVTQVHRCQYCSFAHTRAALRAGVSQEEIRSLLAGDFHAAPQEESVALIFAQHCAESEGHPTAEARQYLVDTYGPDMAHDIRAYIRMIMIGNLLGNTFDAFLSRLAGRPAPGSTVRDELGVLLGTVVLVPAGMIRRLRRRQQAI